MTFDLLTLKVVPQSPVTWATSVPILVFLGLSVLELGPMYATDRQTYVRRQTDVRQKYRLMLPPRPPYEGGGVIRNHNPDPDPNPNPNRNHTVITDPQIGPRDPQIVTVQIRLGDPPCSAFCRVP